MKKWNDILESAQEFVDFLERDTFFDKPFVNTIVTALQKSYVLDEYHKTI